MPVRELLLRVDSRELSEWAAYEKATGPLGPAWTNEVLANTNELMQTNNYLLGAKFAQKGRKNPVPEAKHFPRPYETEEDS